MDPSGSWQLSTPREVTKALSVGTELVIQKEINAERFAVNLVGWRAGEYILTDGPSAALLTGHFHCGNRLITRFLNMGRIYGFMANVESILKDPMLLKLSFPSSMEVVELATQVRQKLELPVLINLHDGEGKRGAPEETVAAELCDISLGGCQVRVGKDKGVCGDLVKGRKLMLTLPLPGQRGEAELEAEVRNVRQVCDEAVCGLAFGQGQAAIRNLVVLSLAPTLELTPTPTPPTAAEEKEPQPARRPVKLKPRHVGLTEKKSQGPLTTSPTPAPPRECREPAKATRGKGRPISLDTVTPAYIQELFGLKELKGSLASINQAREVVRSLVRKVGEEEIRDRRVFYLKFLRHINSLDFSLDSY